MVLRCAVGHAAMLAGHPFSSRIPLIVFAWLAFSFEPLDEVTLHLQVNQMWGSAGPFRISAAGHPSSPFAPQPFGNARIGCARWSVLGPGVAPKRASRQFHRLGQSKARRPREAARAGVPLEDFANTQKR